MKRYKNGQKRKNDESKNLVKLRGLFLQEYFDFHFMVYNSFHFLKINTFDS